MANFITQHKEAERGQAIGFGGNQLVRPQRSRQKRRACGRTCAGKRGRREGIRRADGGRTGTVVPGAGRQMRKAGDAA